MSNENGSPLGLYFDQASKVLLVAFSGVFNRDTTIALNTAAKAVVERHGHVAVILDFSAVTELAIELRDWPELGNSRRAIRGKLRMLVAPVSPIFAPLHLHGRHHGGGVDDTVLVPTRQEAYRGLGLVDPKFEPLDVS